MTSKRSTKHAAATPAKAKAPKEPPTITYEQAIGPNPEGLDHQIILAHQLDPHERAKLEKKFAARHEPE